MILPPRGDLLLHQPECRLAAQKRPGQVHVDDLTPLVKPELLDGNRRGARAGIVEQQIESAVALPNRLKQRGHRGRGCHIRRNHKGQIPVRAGKLGRLLERFPTAPGQDNPVSLLNQGQCRSAGRCLSLPR